MNTLNANIKNRSGAFIINYEHIRSIFLVILLNILGFFQALHSRQFTDQNT